MTSKHRHSDGYTVFRCFFLLLLVWPGPKPVVHSHSQFAAGCRQVDELAQHFSRFHAADVAGVDPQALHWHWLITPGDLAQLGLDPHGQARSVSIETDGSLMDQASLAPLPGDAFHWAAIPISRTKEFGRHLDGHAPVGIRLHQLLGVMSC